jgi:enolase
MFDVHERRDGGIPYEGLGTERAVSSVIKELSAAVAGMDAADTNAVDRCLRDADGTSDLHRLGGNAVLAVSLAALLAAAAANEQPLWRHLSDSTGQAAVLPLPMVNVLSGGAHAARRLDIQDVLAIPVGAASFKEAIEWSWRVRRSAQNLAEQRGAEPGVVADEGGIAPTLPTNRSAIELVVDAIERCGLRPGQDVAVAIDVAANQLTDRTVHEPGARRYVMALEGRTLPSAGLLAELAGWTRDYPLISIEDPIADDDTSGWAGAHILPGQLVGDDLIATHVERVAIAQGWGVNAVLIKPNQAGTVSGTHRTLIEAKRRGMAAIVSARSGDTEDHWLADLAVGWGAGQIKVGSTTRSERTAKWNRLLQLEATTQSVLLPYAGASMLAAFKPRGSHV